MELPNHIADMCGIVTAKAQSQAPAEEFKAIRTVWDDTDQVMTVSHRDKVLGWVNNANTKTGPKYRVLSVNNEVAHFYSISLAVEWLIVGAF
jgi:hypothetical protein